MKPRKHRTVFGLSLLVTPLLLAASANAGYGGNDLTEKSTSVTLADLNLATDAGIDMLYKRLQRAAELVCGPQDLRSAGSVAALRSNKECYSETLDRAVASVGNQALERLHGA